MNIGKAIRELRKTKSISQVLLHEKTGISQTALSQIESNFHRANPSSMSKICKALDISEPMLVILALDETDVPENRKKEFETLFPVIKTMIHQIYGK